VKVNNTIVSARESLSSAGDEQKEWNRHMQQTNTTLRYPADKGAYSNSILNM